jgi:hypothetical protein
MRLGLSQHTPIWHRNNALYTSPGWKSNVLAATNRLYS